MKRIEKLSSFHDDHWIVIRDTADKLNQVIEAINSLTERLDEHEAKHIPLEPTQVEPEELPRWETTEEALAREVEPDKNYMISINRIDTDRYILELWKDDRTSFKSIEEAEAAAIKIRNLLKGQS